VIADAAEAQGSEFALKLSLEKTALVALDSPKGFRGWFVIELPKPIP
jgi:hypothetical protein